MDLSELFSAHRGIISEKITERKVRASDVSWMFRIPAQRSSAKDGSGYYFALRVWGVSGRLKGGGALSPGKDSVRDEYNKFKKHVRSITHD